MIMSHSILQLGVQSTLVNQVSYYPQTPTLHCLVEAALCLHVEIKPSVAQLCCKILDTR